MTLSPVEDLVRHRIGLDPSALGAATFARAVAARIAARGAATADAYAAQLLADPAEWATLLDELVVPESWFFRGGRAYFRHLARFVRERAAGRAARVLSVPCGAGEEPYSLAIALHEEGVTPDLARIDAVDLAPGHVARAVAGRYPAFAFREAGADPRPMYFREASPGRWELSRRPREFVRFRAGNLIDPHFLAPEAGYDLILCRNLFIYLTAPARDRAVTNLTRLLAPGGRLCLTPAEADRLPAGLFQPDGPTALAMFARADGTTGPRSGVIPRPAPAPRSGVIPRAAVAPVAVSDPTPAVSGTRFDPPAAARDLADAGRLDAARAACEREIAAAPTAELYSLRGVLHLAAGHPAEAEADFRRALYLDPDHPEALTHMAMLYERRGDPGPASGVRRRLARLDPGAPA